MNERSGSLRYIGATKTERLGMKTIKTTAALWIALAAGGAGAYELQPPQARTTGSSADAVAIGDVDGDGRDDVVLATTKYFDEENDYKIFVFLQRTDGTLAEPVKIPYPGTNFTAVALADLDGDAAKEIIIGDGAGLTLLKWNKLERLRRMRTYEGLTPYVSITNVAVLDADRDGHPDVVGQTWSSGATIFFGDGHGGVRNQTLLPTPLAGYNDIKSGDLNGDGYADLALLSGQGLTHSYVYYNNGTQALSQPTEIIANPEVDVPLGTLGIGDFNGDGRSDLAVMRDRTEVSIFEQTMDGMLDAAGVLSTDWDPNAMIGADLDGNGKTDLVIAHSGGGVGVFYQQDDGLSQAEVLYPGLYASRLKPQGLAVGDINDDGCKDVAMANYNYGLVTYLGNGCVHRADLAPHWGLAKAASPCASTMPAMPWRTTPMRR